MEEHNICDIENVKLLISPMEQAIEKFFFDNPQFKDQQFDLLLNAIAVIAAKYLTYFFLGQAIGIKNRTAYSLYAQILDIIEDNHDQEGEKK